MKILCPFLNNEVRTGGQRRYLELMDDLAARGNEVTGIISEELNYEITNAKVIKVKCSYKHEDKYPKSFRFAKAVKNLPPSVLGEISRNEVIMIHGETHLKTAAWLRKKYGIPLLYAHRNNVVRSLLIALKESSPNRLKLRTLYRLLVHFWYEKRITANADSIVFQSPYDRDDFCKRNPKAVEKSVIIRGNIGLPRFKKEWENCNESKFLKKIVFLGALGERKGIIYLLKALGRLNERGIKDIELDVLGPGKKEIYLGYIREQKMEERIRFQGRVSNPFDYLRESDLMVVPSIFDSYPDTVLEALHSGIPVIGSRAGGIPDMLEKDELLFPVQDSVELAATLEKMYKSREYYNHVRELCAERQAQFHFDWSGMWEEALLIMAKKN